MNTNEIAKRLFDAVMKDHQLAKAIEDAGLSINLVNERGESVFNDPNSRPSLRGRKDLFEVLTSDRFVRGAGLFLNLVDRLASRPEDDGTG